MELYSIYEEVVGKTLPRELNGEGLRTTLKPSILSWELKSGTLTALGEQRLQYMTFGDGGNDHPNNTGLGQIITNLWTLVDEQVFSEGCLVKLQVLAVKEPLMPRFIFQVIVFFQCLLCPKNLGRTFRASVPLPLTPYDTN